MPAANTWLAPAGGRRSSLARGDKLPRQRRDIFLRLAKKLYLRYYLWGVADADFSELPPDANHGTVTPHSRCDKQTNKLFGQKTILDNRRFGKPKRFLNSRADLYAYFHSKHAIRLLAPDTQTFLSLKDAIAPGHMDDHPNELVRTKFFSF